MANQEAQSADADMRKGEGDFEGWLFYPCGCGYRDEHFIACGYHYFTYNGPVEHLARAAHERRHPGKAWWSKKS